MKRMKLTALAVVTVFVTAVFAQTVTGGMLELNQTWTGNNTFNGTVAFGSTVTFGGGSGGTIAGFLTYQMAAGNFAGLPACNSGAEGTLGAVKDSTTTTYGATITGGSSGHVLAYCNGTNWTVH